MSKIYSLPTYISYMKSDSMLLLNNIARVNMSEIDTKAHYLDIVLLILMLLFVKIIKTLLKEETNNLLSIVWEN